MGVQSPAGMYGRPSGGCGVDSPPYNGFAEVGAGAPGGGGADIQYDMYQYQMSPHSRAGSQDTTQWRNSPYDAQPAYNGAYGIQHGGQPVNPGAPSGMTSRQSPYTGGRAGRGASNMSERPFKCYECPQSFQRSHDLKRHKRIHLDMKPFPCSSCDKAFSRSDALKRHIRIKGCGNTGS